MIEWRTIVIILSIVLLAFLLWREWSRVNKELLGARLIATLIAIASLYMLAIPPGYTRKAEQVINELVLFTNGAVKDSVAKNSFNNMPLFDIDKDGVDEMLRKHRGVNTIHVFGYGLESYQLEKLSGQKLVFHPSAAPVGFSQIQYKNELVQGETMELQGRFHRQDSMKTSVLLMSFGTVLDSAHSNDHGVFTLKCIPAQIGVATYSLIALNGSDTLEKQLVPMNVAKRQPLRVLLLGSAPGFESRFLKDWLSRKEYQVLSRTRVSKNIYTKDFVNEEPKQVDFIGIPLLDQTDIIVADNGALASLSGDERRNVSKAIREKGLGMLICMNGNESAKEAGIMFRVGRIPGGMQQKLDLILNGGVALKSLITEDQYEINKNDQLLPLVQDKSGRIFAAAAMEGQGRIVINTINYSYKWMLSGSENDYDQYWAKLLSGTLGSAGEDSWQLSPRWPLVDQPTTLTVETAQDAPVGVINGQKFFLQNSPQFPQRWQGVFWPRTVGWNSLTKSDGSEQLFFVFDPNSWQALRMNERIKRTRDYIVMHDYSVTNEVRQEFTEKKQVPAIFFLLLFMSAAGFLWYEQKRMKG